MRFASFPTWRAFKFLVIGLAISTTALRVESARAQTPEKRQRMPKASELIRKQDPPMISARLMEKVTPDNSRVLVSLSKQRAWLMLGEEAVIDTPISSGKAAGLTPTGSFTVVEKDPHHRSTLYGDFVDGKGRVVRAGVSLKIDSAPSGTHFVGAPMEWFCRFNGAVGMHVGILPGYAASHGCVRLPKEIAPRIYEKVKVGTPVEVVP
jgi:lipoprotein-anchoring transpeptidase ErfK/SrfK